MDDDDYQRIADYENAIYGLNSQDSQDEGQENVPSKAVPDQQSPEGSDSEDSTSQSSQPKSTKNPSQVNGVERDIPSSVEYTVKHENRDSSDLSDDERDEIYARLYHGNNTLRTSLKPAPVNPDKTNSTKTRKSKSKPQNGTNLFSNEFTFDIDLDDLPPPPEPVLEVSTLDSDGDFSVPPPPSLSPFLSIL
jgi:hypothetical protein